MAKWGEGDPGWRERADATTNSWPWAERDASDGSTDTLKALFLAVRVQTEEGKCEVTEVNKLDGEMSIHNRKGKLIFFYEWSITLNRMGTSKSGAQYKGHAETPNLSDENSMDDVRLEEPDTDLVALRKEGPQRSNGHVLQHPRNGAHAGHDLARAEWRVSSPHWSASTHN
ncbi:unnamed protein product [Pipistrellus nathusii]|uniref:Activator of Hsp90 ATPase AHSA1-like N-terminal domain-containing protein n=1 Tax=Pipistrellus nathusii TaxID=59473 RepID=A0ABN9ZUG6_PIPNA